MNFYYLIRLENSSFEYVLHFGKHGSPEIETLLGEKELKMISMQEIIFQVYMTLAASKLSHLWQGHVIAN